jgi:Na+-transporting methylmalonyl-CoA/oxaloacetate decarboxylase beta subunit
MTLRRLCPALLVLGVGLMIPFETPITLLLGVAALLGFVVSGVFLVASPDFLDADQD